MGSKGKENFGMAFIKDGFSILNGYLTVNNKKYKIVGTQMQGDGHFQQNNWVHYRLSYCEKEFSAVLNLNTGVLFGFCDAVSMPIEANRHFCRAHMIDSSGGKTKIYHVDLESESIAYKKSI
ncbi:hypothetical protein CSB11_00055 [Candidatus Campbellbacteria bacterium]|nr:MAG: hypothetical protein CSB11_00055 [Candidatus Campbellbacteria bacterium]